MLFRSGRIIEELRSAQHAGFIQWVVMQLDPHRGAAEVFQRGVGETGNLVIAQIGNLQVWTTSHPPRNPLDPGVTCTQHLQLVEGTDIQQRADRAMIQAQYLEVYEVVQMLCRFRIQ